jgi:hypothetical protein
MASYIMVAEELSWCSDAIEPIGIWIFLTHYNIW